MQCVESGVELNWGTNNVPMKNLCSGSSTILGLPMESVPTILNPSS